MTKWRNSFPVRASHRLYENRGKACPGCSQKDPLLLGRNGRCANCTSQHKEEIHHVIAKSFRRDKEDELLVFQISPNAHRLLSDMQAGHPFYPKAVSDVCSSVDSWSLELIVSTGELSQVLTYLNENLELRQILQKVIAILLTLWFMSKIKRIDLSKSLEKATMKHHEGNT
jgi:hypothetical protein